MTKDIRWQTFNSSIGHFLGKIPIYPIGIIGQSGLTYGVIPTKGANKEKVTSLFCTDEIGFGEISELHFFEPPISSSFSIEASYSKDEKDFSLAAGFFCIPKERAHSIFLNLLFPTPCSLHQIHTYVLSVDITPKITPANDLLGCLPQLKIQIVRNKWIIVTTKEVDLPRTHKCSTTKECMIPIHLFPTLWCVIDLKPANKITFGSGKDFLKAQYLLR